MIAESIIGRKKSDDKYDLYETPTWATELIVNRLIKDGILTVGEEILEPCSGAGAISKVLENKFIAKSSDIQTEDFIYREKSIDVYAIQDKSANTVFTNPPYNLMTENNMLNEFLRISIDKVV